MKKLLTMLLSTSMLLTCLCPVFAMDEDELLQPVVPKPAHDHAEVHFYADAERTEPLSGADVVHAGDTVYYEIVCEPGYVCRSAVIGATEANKTSFVSAFDNAASALVRPRIDVNGDLDGNGKFDDKDATLMLRLLARWTVTYWEIRLAGRLDLADFNRDGEVNQKDATCMLRQLAGWYDSPMGDGTAEQHIIAIAPTHATVLAYKECDYQDNVHVIDSPWMLASRTADLDEDFAASLTEIYGETYFETHKLVQLDLFAGDNYDRGIYLTDDLRAQITAEQVLRVFVSLPKDADVTLYMSYMHAPL